jgi:hypothetical protein
MSDIPPMLKRQADWQQSRRRLSWPEKIRMVEAVRESLLQLRSATSQATPPPAQGEAPSLVRESEEPTPPAALLTGPTPAAPSDSAQPNPS